MNDGHRSLEISGKNSCAFAAPPGMKIAKLGARLLFQYALRLFSEQRFRYLRQVVSPRPTLDSRIRPVIYSRNEANRP
jgi:hypothetical protein